MCEKLARLQSKRSCICVDGYITLSLGAFPMAFPNIWRAPLRFSWRISNWAARSHIFANENFWWGIRLRHSLKKWKKQRTSVWPRLNSSTVKIYDTNTTMNEIVF